MRLSKALILLPRISQVLGGPGSMCHSASLRQQEHQSSEGHFLSQHNASLDTELSILTWGPRKGPLKKSIWWHHWNAGNWRTEVKCKFLNIGWKVHKACQARKAEVYLIACCLQSWIQPSLDLLLPIINWCLFFSQPCSQRIDLGVFFFFLQSMISYHHLILLLLLS